MIFELPVRPITAWPGALTPESQRKSSPFASPWGRTLELLEHELDMLNARSPVLHMAITELDIRRDGRVRADARPEHPGVIISFDSKYGRLQYATDRFLDWQDNARAIALSLEALRKVDRYGVAGSGQQYAGWKALPGPTGNGKQIETRQLSRSEAMRELIRIAGYPPGVNSVDPETGYRLALKRAHPDVGGSREDWDLLQQIKAVLGIGQEVAS